MSLRSSSQQPPGVQYMSNAIGSNRESNPSRRICNLRAVPLGHVANNQNLRMKIVKNLKVDEIKKINGAVKSVFSDRNFLEKKRQMY